MKRFIFSLGAFAVLFGGTVDAQTIACQTNSPKTAQLRALAVRYAASPDYSAFRAEYSIGAIDTATIAVVSQDSICDAVTRSINAKSTAPRSTAFLVVKFGNYFAAAVPEGAGIEAVFILDDQAILKTVFVGT